MVASASKLILIEDVALIHIITQAVFGLHINAVNLIRIIELRFVSSQPNYRSKSSATQVGMHSEVGEQIVLEEYFLTAYRISFV